MNRARQEVLISNEMALDASTSPMHLAPYPPSPWYLRGSRGGRYVATGMIERMTTQDTPEAWMRNCTLVVDRSEGVRYIRPGTAEARDFDEAMA